MCWRATAKACGQERWPQPARRSRQQRRLLQRDQAGARVLRPRSQPARGAALRAQAIRSLPWQAVRRSRKSPLHARALAPTMSVPRLPGTSGRASSKSAMGDSTPYRQPGRTNRPRSDDRRQQDSLTTLLAELSLRESLKCRPSHGGPMVRIHLPPLLQRIFVSNYNILRGRDHPSVNCDSEPKE